MSAEELAQFFHTTYERLAPSYGYQTRPESAVDWQHVPANNRQLMIAVAREVLKHLAGTGEPGGSMPVPPNGGKREGADA